MTVQRAVTALAVTAMFAAAPAQARFGKSGSNSSSSSSSSHSSSSSSRASSTSSSSSSSADSGGSYHAAAPVGSVPPSAGGGAYVPRPGPAYRYGYYSGYFVPVYGYGYASCAPPVGYAGATAGAVQSEPASLRLTAGVEGMTFVNNQQGVTLGVKALFEGERWGFLAHAQDILVRADNGSNTTDSLPQLNLHATYAFLSGRYGRLRAEVGADTVWATDAVFVGATGGLSGLLWLGGPVALEGSAMATPWPYWQLDYQAGVVVGLGALGLRAGWRTQVLDDRGLIDGVDHRDVFMGPYLGLSLAL